MQHEALQAVADMTDTASLPLGLCLFDESWHQGVVGLVASRIKDRVHRPVIALARGDADSLKGSARSIGGVHIRDVLDADRHAAPGTDRKVRWPRDGGRTDAAGSAAGRIPRRIR